MHTGDKIRHFRTEKGFKQEYVADRIGMKQQEYSKMERGEKSVTVEKLQQIAQVLEVELMKIIEYGDGPVFNSINQNGGSANNYHHHESGEIDKLEKINALLTENIKLKEEILQLKRRLGE
jgi:transcriptional regulator with XRE-family HTH domain